jgi:EAL domain-containing protein (putative c-di-GMP-specific phosphodiesterase class I)/CheY-like chemotaxis protein
MAAPVKGRVLFVDDNVPLLEVCNDILQTAGYEVTAARDGQAAMETMDGAEFDVVVSDINMPGMDGLQLLRAVRGKDLDVPVLLVTGNPNLDTAIQAVEQGALRYLVKPLGADTLTEAVEHAARLGRMARLKRLALTHLGAHDKLLGDRAGLESRFERAIASLWMAYQPIVTAKDGALFAREALVRTREDSLTYPGALFDAAERLGRVAELSRSIRDEVARNLQSGAVGGTVFVNLHSLDLTDDSLLQPGAALSAHARSVVLEVTENAPLHHISDLRQRVKDMRDLGYRIAVDDLGAGYAGLTSFATLEPDVVKLDMTLVRDIDTQVIKQKLVASMASLCRELGIPVVAEGVETAAEREMLESLGCDLLQGYLFGRPAPLPPIA